MLSQRTTGTPKRCPDQNPQIPGLHLLQATKDRGAERLSHRMRILVFANAQSPKLNLQIQCSFNENSGRVFWNSTKSL